jgi:hypothetical protein
VLTTVRDAVFGLYKWSLLFSANTVAEDSVNEIMAKPLKIFTLYAPLVFLTFKFILTNQHT